MNKHSRLTHITSTSLGTDDVKDARAAVAALRIKLEDAYNAEHAASVARLLARRALDEAIERLARLEREVEGA